MDIFIDDGDYEFFLRRLQENVIPEMVPISGRSPGGYTPKTFPSGAFAIFCYCLMPNHFHILIKQLGELPVSALVLKVCTSYGKYFNKKYGRIGSVFCDAFKSVPVTSDEYILWLSAYIHQNPKVAGLVGNLADYGYSSYPDYLGIRRGALADKKFVLNLFPDGAGYKNFVESAFDPIAARKAAEHLFLD